MGTSGSGKSTLSRALAAAIGTECLELDSVFHQPGWVPLPREEFRRRVAAAVAGNPVAVSQDLQRLMFSEAIGRPLAITVMRNGALVDVIAEPSELVNV